MKRSSLFQKLFAFCGLILLLVQTSNAQTNKTKRSFIPDSSIRKETVKQLDLKDVFNNLFSVRHRETIAEAPDSGLVFKPLAHPVIQADSLLAKPGKILFAPFPAVGYTLQTGVTAILATNLSFYTAKKDSTNLSSIALNSAISLTYPQVLLPLIFSIWSPQNKYNFLGDCRYYKYPTYTYGLGGHTSLSDADNVDYSYIRVYQEVLRKISHSDFYAGLGYNLDYHFNISETEMGKDFNAYNGNATKTTSSGLVANVLYDSRKNTNYPENATYISLSYRHNTTLLKSDQNWQSVCLDFRKFINLSPSSTNVLAFWSLDWFTFGKAPYFDLPSTGWDSNSNTGRGYIQSRLRGPGMLYVESEYRFGITKNGLFGGVVFANAESISEWGSKRFETILPGYGLGARIKINKTSNVRLALDYGFGAENSQGLFFNVSEIF